MLIVIQALLLAVLAYRMFRKQPDDLRPFFYPALALKLTAGLLLGWFYLNADYKGDTFVYFNDAQAIVDLASRDVKAYIALMWRKDPGDVDIGLVATQPRAFFFSKLTSVLLLFSGRSYVMLSLWFSYISFSGAWYLVRVLSSVLKLRHASILALLFFPSVVFWSSGVIKESVSIAALFFLTGVFLKAYLRQPIRIMEWILLPFSLWILWNLKYYYLAVFLPVTTTLLIMKLLVGRYLRIQNNLGYGLISMIVFVFPIFIVSVVHPNFYPERILHVIAENYYTSVAQSSPDNVIHLENLQPSPAGILPHVPTAALSGIFRPFIWEVTNATQLVAALENLVIFILLVLSVFYCWKRKFQMKELVIWTVIYIVVLDIFLTLSSPNFGTLSRYRVGFLPFLILLISTPLPWQKFKLFS